MSELTEEAIVAKLRAYPISSWKMTGPLDWENLYEPGKSYTGGDLTFQCINPAKTEVKIVFNIGFVKEQVSYTKTSCNVYVDKELIFNNDVKGADAMNGALWEFFWPIYKINARAENSAKEQKKQQAQLKL